MAGRVNTIKRGGSRFYVEPESGAKVPGVTSVVNMLPQPYLKYWAAKMTAEAAVDNLAAVASIAQSDRDGAVDYLKGAHRRYTKARADVGSQAHDLFERMLRGEAVRRVGLDLEPYRRNFAEFLARVRPEMISAEDVVWSDAHDYAGSSDAILRIDGMTVIVDWKTSRDTYPDVALQLAAYAHADRIVSPDGRSRPLPEIEAGAVLHITPERWALKPVNITRPVFDVFLHLRAVFDWDRELCKAVVGRPVESGGRLETGTERRAK